MDIARQVLKEPETSTIREYKWRVRGLAFFFAATFIIAMIGDVIVVVQVKKLITLAQRSNVETLTVAFFLIFFSYLATICFPGFWTTLTLVRFRILALFRGRLEVEKHKQKALGAPVKKNFPCVALNAIAEREDNPHQPFEIVIEDAAGSLGRMRFDGARIEHVNALKDGSNSLFSYLARQINELMDKRGIRTELDIVEWKKLDDEATEKYLGLVKFAHNLELRLPGAGPDLWPKVKLTAQDCLELENHLSELCPTLRTEFFLPHWEYAGDHKLPIIPEPLGIISLSRDEKRVDPFTALGALFFTLLVSFGLLIFLVVSPPWVPGK